MTTKDSSHELEKQYNEGFRLLKKGEYASAFPILLNAAEHGHPGAQDYVGRMYTEGVGVAIDLKEGFRWTKESAENGCAAAQTNLARCYQFGTGVDKSIDLALKWMKEAADNGDPMGIHNLASFYREGYLLPQDDNKAIEYYQLAISKGFARSMNDLGVLHQSRGEYYKAYSLYLEATQRDEPKSFWNLARLLFNGNGCERNVKKALEYALNEPTPSEECREFIMRNGVKLVGRALYLHENGYAAFECIEFAKRCHVPSVWILDDFRRTIDDLVVRGEAYQAYDKGNSCLASGDIDQAFSSYFDALYRYPEYEFVEGLLKIDNTFISDVEDFY